MSTKFGTPNVSDPGTKKSTDREVYLPTRSSVSEEELSPLHTPINPPNVDTSDLEFLELDDGTTPLSEAHATGEFRAATHPDDEAYLKKFAMREIAEIDALQEQGKNREAMARGENYWARSHSEEFSWPRYLYLSEVAAKMCLLLDPIRDQEKLRGWHDRLKPVYVAISREVVRLETKIRELEVVPERRNEEELQLQQMRSEYQDIKYYHLILFYIDDFFDKCLEYLEATANPQSVVQLNTDGTHTYNGQIGEWQFEVSTWAMFCKRVDSILEANPVSLPQSRKPSGAVPAKKTGGTALLPEAEESGALREILTRFTDSLPVAVKKRLTPPPQPATPPTTKPRVTKSQVTKPGLPTESISLQPEYVTALRLRAGKMLLLIKRAARRMDTITIANENILRSGAMQRHGPTRAETILNCRAMQQATRQAIISSDLYLNGTVEGRTPDGSITKEVPGFRGPERERSPQVLAEEISTVRRLIDIGELFDAKNRGDALIHKLNRLGEAELAIQLNAIIGYGLLTFAQHLLPPIEKPIVSGAEKYRPIFGNKPLQDKLLEEARKLGFNPEKYTQEDITSALIGAGIKKLRDSNKRVEAQKPEPNQNLMRRLRNELMFGIALKLRSGGAFPGDFQNGAVRGVIERAVQDLNEIDPTQSAQVYLPRIAEVLYWASVRKEPKFDAEKKIKIIATARKYAIESLRFFDEEIGDPIDDDAIKMEMANVRVVTDFVLGRGETMHTAGTDTPEHLPEDAGIEIDTGTLGLGRKYHFRRSVPPEYFYLLHYRRAYVAAVARYQPTEVYPGARGQ